MFFFKAIHRLDSLIAAIVLPWLMSFLSDLIVRNWNPASPNLYGTNDNLFTNQESHDHSFSFTQLWHSLNYCTCYKSDYGLLFKILFQTSWKWTGPEATLATWASNVEYHSHINDDCSNICLYCNFKARETWG